MAPPGDREVPSLSYTQSSILTLTQNTDMKGHATKEKHSILMDSDLVATIESVAGNPENTILAIMALDEATVVVVESDAQDLHFNVIRIFRLGDEWFHSFDTRACSCFDAWQQVQRLVNTTP
jgi:hypothetical protein